MLRSVAGSIFFASQCAAALSSTADMLVRNCTKMGTEVLYMEIVMECGSFAGGDETERNGNVASFGGERCHVNGIWLRFSVGTGAPSCETTRRTSPRWICSLFRPLASICCMPLSSFGCSAETWSGSTSQHIRRRNGLRVWAAKD